MSEEKKAQFIDYLATIDTLSPAQRDVCAFIYNHTASIINQMARSKKPDTVMNAMSVVKLLYRLMSYAHRFVEFSGEDKKEVVIYTILGGFHVMDAPLSTFDQELMEQMIDVVWWASHEAVFAVKKKCGKWCGCGADPAKHNASEPLKVTDTAVSGAATKVAVDVGSEV